MKNLKTTGNLIKSFEVKKTTEKFQGNDVDVIHLTVKTDETYKFRVCKDVRHPSLDITKTNLEKKLNDSIKDYNKFSVTKYAERNYIFIDDTQYTGIQLQ